MPRLATGIAALRVVQVWPGSLHVSAEVSLERDSSEVITSSAAAALACVLIKATLCAGQAPRNPALCTATPSPPAVTMTAASSKAAYSKTVAPCARASRAATSFAASGTSFYGLQSCEGGKYSSATNDHPEHDIGSNDDRSEGDVVIVTGAEEGIRLPRPYDAFVMVQWPCSTAASKQKLRDTIAGINAAPKPSSPGSSVTLEKVVWQFANADIHTRDSEST